MTWYLDIRLTINFDNSGNGFGIFNIASSPNEFVLIRLTLNKKRTAREFRSGTSNSYENSSGLDDDQRIPFTFEEIKSGVFVVKTSENLRSGEYCFLYAAQAGNEQNGNKVFDFTVE